MMNDHSKTRTMGEEGLRLTKECLNDTNLNNNNEVLSDNNNNTSHKNIIDNSNSAENIDKSNLCDKKSVENFETFQETEFGRKCTELLYEYTGYKFLAPIKWFNSIAISLFHIAGVYTFLFHSFEAKFLSVLWGFTMGGAGGFGVTAGVHRLWCHRAYKAKLPLRIILMVCYSIAGQNTIYDWVRDHRIHHKYSETDADPHNSNRGFFFAHVGWLMLRKHPEVIRRGRQTDMSDIVNDPVVKFHHKHFILMKILCCFIIPTIIPMWLWNESFKLAFLSQCMVRYILGLNFTWLVNSAAHLWGQRPYDKRINPVQNLGVAIVAMGEGWHNYHHVFPWDYKAAELGDYSLNVTTFWLDLFSKIGWAYDLKEPSKEIVKKTIQKYGDGTHLVFGHGHMQEVPPPADNDKTL